MAKQVTTKVDRTAAEQFGRMAFRAGTHRAPCLDGQYNDWRKEKYPNVIGAVTELGTEWLRGWDRENRAS